MPAQQDIIDQLIDYIDKAILKNSVSNRHVAAVLAFLNEGLKNSKDIFVSKINDDSVAGHLTLAKGATSEGLFEANAGLVVRKQELFEAASMSLIEEGEDMFIEELSVDIPTSATTLGELTNVSDDADKASETNDLLIRLAGASDWTIDTTLFSKVSQLMVKVFPFTLSLSGGGIYEQGSTQTVNLSWTYDREISSQSINSELLAIDVRNKQYTGVNTNTTYTLKTECGGQMHTKSVSAQFKPKKYYGISAINSLTNAQILALSSAWATRAQGSTVFDCTGGKYPYYIIPTSMTAGIQFWIGGLQNTDWKEDIQEVTNAFGYTESYTIFRLNSIQTGVLNIEMK